MKKNIFVTYLFTLSLSSTISANEALSIELLTTEADKTEMSNVQSSLPNTIEPAVKPYQTMDTNSLSAYIADKLSGVLATEDTTNNKEIEAKLEGIVSSALLSGVSMDDLRSAVSSAMDDIKDTKNDEDMSEKIDLTSASLDKLIGKSNQNQQKNRETSTTSIVPSASNRPKTITVLKGESLYKVALRVYGNGNEYLRLYNANKDIITDPNIIQVGQILRVP